MKADIKKRWTDALRSGQFVQGQGQLCWLDEANNRHYCCLGVLCKLAVEDRIAQEREVPSGGPKTTVLFGTPYSSIESSARLVSGIRDWADLGTGWNAGTEAQLVEMNDSDHAPFPQIADWIDQNIEVTP